MLAAAVELITEKGWDATTAAEIGRRAGYSRAMVHARYGGKDGILDSLIADEYVRRLLPDDDTASTGLDRALAHFDRIRALYEEDPVFVRAIFTTAFEAVKHTSPLRPRVQAWLSRGADDVAAVLRQGIDDGSVRADVDIDKAVSDIGFAGIGLAYQWLILPERCDLGGELVGVRARMVADYGAR